jgi:hypothetical protein
MIYRLQDKACRSCSAAKRKCTKEVPACSRCRKQNLDCRYPPSKPSCFVLISDEEESVEELPLVLHSSPGLDSSDVGCSILPDLLSRSHGPDLDHCASPEANLVALSNWFSGPGTWTVTKWPQTRHLWHPSGLHIKRLVAIMYDWYVQWLHTTSNPFIHKEFYRYRYPRCIQDASSTLASYLQRTPENTVALLRLIDCRATQLLADHGTNATHISGTPGCSQYSTGTDMTMGLDTHGHIARIHALSLYQLLALFSPKPELRRHAEARIPVLVRWMQDLINHAQEIIPSLDESLYDDRGRSPPRQPRSADIKLWHNWILAESARRAFMIGTTVQALYLVLRDGVSASAAARYDLLGGGCKGGMPFTTRRGAWEASDAEQWANLAVEVDFGLTYVHEARNLLAKTGAREEWDVDTFAKVFIRGTYGRID